MRASDTTACVLGFANTGLEESSETNAFVDIGFLTHDSPKNNVCICNKQCHDMRDDLVYGKGLFDDGWNKLRDRLKTSSDELYKLYYTEDELPHEYVTWRPNGTRDIPATTRRLFWNPFVFATNPALYSYYVVFAEIPKEYVGNNDDVPSQMKGMAHDTFLTHMSRRYANMYCRLSTFNTAARLVYNLFATVSPVNSTFRSYVETFVGDDVPNSEQTFMASIHLDRIVRVVMSTIFHSVLCLSHIAIMSSGFMYRAVAIIRGHSHVNIIQDELVIQLVKLYAADIIYWQDMARKSIEMIPGAGNPLAMLLFDGFWKNQMSMWMAHLWVALTPPMTRVVETIQKSELPDKQLARELETDPYWSLIPIGKAYDDMINCRNTEEVAHGITNVDPNASAISLGQHDQRQSDSDAT